jgi:hypothetical protein
MPKSHDVVYCGIWREQRRESFVRYLKGDMLLASAEKSKGHFYEMGIRCKQCDGSLWSWKPGNETFNQFRYALYIEDEELHDLKRSFPALRLYDAITCNVVTLFDHKCRQTMERTGWPMRDDFYVSGYDDLMAKVRDDRYLERLEFQREWANIALLEQSEVFYRLAELCQSPVMTS